MTPERIAELKKLCANATNEDAEFIAASRTALPECLEEIERLREERNNEAWMHSLCLGIAESIPGWETAKDASPAIIAVKKLRAQLEEAREALQSCISGTHMWVITPESSSYCLAAFDYIREKARAYLEKYK